MPHRRPFLRTFLVLLASPLLCGFITFGVDRPCQRETLTHLDGLKVERDRVKKIHIRSHQQAGRSTTRTLGHRAWVQLKGCDGDLVIEMRRFCEFKQAYTTRNCRLPNIPKA